MVPGLSSDHQTISINIIKSFNIIFIYTFIYNNLCSYLKHILRASITWICFRATQKMETHLLWIPWILDFPVGKYKQSPCKQTQHNCTFFARSTKTLRTLWVNTRAWGISEKNKKTCVLDWRPRVLIFRLITKTNSYFQDGVKYTGFCQENPFTPSDFCGFSFSIHILQPRCPEPSIRSNCKGPGKSCRMDCRCCSSGPLPQGCHWVIPPSDSETDDQSYQSSSFLCSQISGAQVQGPFQSSLTHGRQWFAHKKLVPPGNWSWNNQ